jgi:hypothetical protein
VAGVRTGSPAADLARIGFRVMLAMLGMIAVPGALTLDTVRAPARTGPWKTRPGQTGPVEPSPYGYTVSLLLFVVPILVVGFWLAPREKVQISKQSLVRTIAILFPVGAGLDFFFPRRFFTFPNAGATLQIIAPALGGGVPVDG